MKQDHPLPLFLCLEASSHNEDSHPIAAAWSLPDGSIKSTLISPEDDWQDWDPMAFERHGIDQEQLMIRGESTLSVAKEIDQDLDCQAVYAQQPVFGAPPSQQGLLEKLYASIDSYPPINLLAVEELLHPVDYEQYQQQKEDICLSLGLNPEHAEDAVRLLQQLYIQRTHQLP